MTDKQTKAVTTVANSRGLSTGNLASTDAVFLKSLPARLDDAQLAEVKRIASIPVPALRPVDRDHLLYCIRTLSILPTRADDATTADLRLAMFQRHLGDQPKAAMDYLTDHMIRTSKWFPSIAECLEVLKGWKRTDGAARAIAFAQAALAKERTARFDEIRLRLRRGQMEQAEVDALSDQAKAILVCECLIADGSFQIIRRAMPDEGKAE